MRKGEVGNTLWGARGTVRDVSGEIDDVVTLVEIPFV
jgi:hypothetical protein